MSWFLVCVVLALLSLAHAAHTQNSYLNVRKFDDVRTEYEAILIKFCVSHVKLCQQYESTWNTLMEDFSADPKVLIAEIDCKHQAQFCKQQKVFG